MSVREVLKMGHPLLRQKAQAVTSEEIADGSLDSLVKDLYDTMAVEDGIGIAAPQIGVLKASGHRGFSQRRQSPLPARPQRF